jgi:hypothetical protein
VNNLDGESGWELYRCAVDRAHLEQAVTLFGQAVRAIPVGLEGSKAETMTMLPVIGAFMIARH